jgi:hypothetical protein
MSSWTWAGLSTGPEVKINDSLATVASHPCLRDSEHFRWVASPNFKKRHVSGISTSAAHLKVLDASEIAWGFGATNAQDISWKLFILLGRMYQEKVCSFVFLHRFNIKLTMHRPITPRGN